MPLERLSPKLIKSGESIFHWCPACKCAHRYDVPRWDFNGNNDAPTFLPSMMIYVPHYDKALQKFDDSKRRVLCHYWVKAGAIEFCGDSPHDLKGQTVPLPDFPSGYNLGGDVT